MSAPSFQQVMTTLISFWIEQGCLFQQGYDVETGAGTFNPMTFLRCLGPEPFNVVYIEPSRRPQDGRFGKNPNRMQLFHQLQVVMKPSPFDIQQRFLQSLEAIGLSLSQHDLRFVHDDWDSPTLGAWGLGWEVWIDGMEVTQFTYFQSMANLPLHPVSVELTYGLERLTMLLQSAQNIFDITWGPNLTYGDLRQREEVEWSRYNFIQADVKMWSQHFQDFSREVQRLTEHNLPIPAYDFVIKASHAFNLLEARGVLSVSERTSYIKQIRGLAKKVALSYLASREREHFPLCKKFYEPQKGEENLADSSPPSPWQPEDFLLEIGSEELPASFISPACQQLKELAEQLFHSLSLSYVSLASYGSPRRLSLIVRQLSPKQEISSTLRKGPRLNVIFDQEGRVTTPGKHFFDSIELHPSPSLEDIQKERFPSLQIQMIKNHHYLMIKTDQEKLSTSGLLAQHLPQLILSLSFPKTMCWNYGEIKYARPIHWIVSLYGSQVIPFTLFSVHSGRCSRGHAQRSPQSFSLDYAGEYLSMLAARHVMVDISQRRASVLQQLKQIEEESGLRALKVEEVLEQVLFLSEWPQLLLATFDEKFLDIPQEILISEMVEHQRYFPLAREDGSLSHMFVLTVDNQPNEMILSGNQNVLYARFQDGEFLYQQDLQFPFETFSERLDSLIFHDALGTMAAKRERLKTLSLSLAKLLEIEGEEEKILRTAYLCKADLTTSLVQEFPSLQGTIGKDYALHYQEDREVALAIEEHWLPRFEKGELPKSWLGALFSIVDKVDTLVGYFSLKLEPTSSQDPYAMRRQSIAILKILIDRRWDVDLSLFFEKGFSLFSSHPFHQERDSLMHYCTKRLHTVLQGYGWTQEEISLSCLNVTTLNPYDQYRRTQALHFFQKTKDFPSFQEGNKRVKKQIAKYPSYPFCPALLQADAENRLYITLAEITPSFDQAIQERNYPQAFRTLSVLPSLLHLLFEQVKILDENPSLQQNRLALLQKVSSLFSSIFNG